MELKAAREHIDYIKKHHPEEYANLLKGYKTENDLLWEIRHFTNQALKLMRELKVK